MTRGVRGSRQPKRHPLPEKPAIGGISRMNNRLVLFIIVVILTAIPFLLGKYFEFNSPGAYDGGAYVYSAKHILAGARIGVEEKPSAQIGTLLVNMLGVALFGFSDTGPKVIQMILQSAALVLMFLSVRKLFGRLAAGIAVIMASVYLSSPLIAKFGNVKEQYMIAFMVMGMSCFILHQLGGRWWQALLAGAFLSWAGLFKQTGVSAIGAVGVFILAQPLLKNRSWRETGRDIGLLLAGAAAGMAPIYIWILGWSVQLPLPYSFVWETAAKLLPSGGAGEAAKPASDYIGESRKLVPFSEQWPRVLRYYGLFVLPIGLAVSSLVARLVRAIAFRAGSGHAAEAVGEPEGVAGDTPVHLRPGHKVRVRRYDHFVLLLGVWWILDMAFVWISPRSYEQYYLPLNASAAMLSGYIFALYSGKVRNPASRPKWVAVGILGLLLMVVLSWHIFFGISKSPHSGTAYGGRTKGYWQKFGEIHRRRKENLKAPWETTGEYILEHSEPSDKIYVWGWVPGIYVKAQRFSSASKAFSMPRPAPPVLGEIVDTLLSEFRKEMPKFIVDTRKRHIPTERPPYVLWPMVPKGYSGASKNWFLPANKQLVASYDRQWADDVLRTRFGEDEALRYEEMAPFREFVMQNYEIAEPTGYFPIQDSRLLYHRIFGEHVVFRLKSSGAGKERQ